MPVSPAPRSPSMSLASPATIPPIAPTVFRGRTTCPLARFSTSQYQHFLPTARVVGFDAVSVWLREVDVAAGETVAFDLHDRGVWLSGVAEESASPRRTRFSGGLGGLRGR